MIPFCLLTLLLSGCWDYTELNERNIVTAVAVDEGEELPWLLTVEYVSFEGGSFTGRVISAEGTTLPACEEGLVRQLGRYPYWNQAKVLLLSEPLIKEGGYTGVMDWMVAGNRFSLGILTALVEGSGAGELLRGNQGKDPQGMVLSNMLDDQVAFGRIPPCPLYLLYNASSTGSRPARLPRLMQTGDEEEKAVELLGSLTLSQGEISLSP